MKKQLFLFLLVVGLFFSCGRHSKDAKYAIIAETGRSKITLDEFRNRLEFTPKIYRYGDETANKEMFLASLLNEKIMAEIAAEKAAEAVQRAAGDGVGVFFLFALFVDKPAGGKDHAQGMVAGEAFHQVAFLDHGLAADGADDHGRQVEQRGPFFDVRLRFFFKIC